ncbi:hypothetical protein AVEN_73710-1 [Araneus ventricosus]|uniref:DNA-directed DNA polymerase n=1 Tax=Araneus ventricosus TaxID=182803 RepID=A0A4Y2HQD3_ARAVE|nr:hypothetical protein AVEN_73710-1 [Araneus ventricosus]
MISVCSLEFIENSLPDNIKDKVNEVEVNAINFVGLLNGALASNASGTSNIENEDDDDFSDSPLESAITIYEKNRRPNRRFSSEEINLQALIDMDRFPEEAKGPSIMDVLHIVRSLLVIVLRTVTLNLAPKDLIRFLFDQDRLDKLISAHLMPVAEMTVETMLSRIIHVVQSRDDILLDEGFDIEVITIRRPVGVGSRKVVIPSIDCIRKSSIISVNWDDYGVCCAKAILLALARLEKDVDFAAMRRKDCNILLRKALSLHDKTGIEVGPCRVNEISTFEDYLNVQVILFSTAEMNQVAYKGKKRERRVYIFLHDGHYEVLTSPKVAHYLDGTEFVFDGYGALNEFCCFLFSPKHKWFTAIAHNMKGFDGQLVLRWLLERGQCPKVISNGTKLMSILLRVGSIRIIDSCNFLPMPLSKMPKTFGLKELRKEFFPHLFNMQENQTYVGPLPDASYYSPNTMSLGDRKAFFQWYDNEVET